MRRIPQKLRNLVLSEYHPVFLSPPGSPSPSALNLTRSFTACYG